MIEEAERAKMLKANSIGPRMPTYLEEIGIHRLSPLACDLSPHRVRDAQQRAVGVQAQHWAAPCLRVGPVIGGWRRILSERSDRLFLAEAYTLR